MHAEMTHHQPHPRCARSHRTRIAGSLAATLCAGLASASAVATTLEEIVVTATRRPVPASSVPLSLGSLGPRAITLVGATHHSEILNRAPGVMIQRGSGQESLTAIRSPVLTGPGSCGAFLFLENGVPIRPVGFCNVNGLLDVNTEQALALEVLRGPGTALYGSSAMHGMVNVLQPAPEERPQRQVALEAGPSSYGRVKLAGRFDGGRARLGIAALYAHDGGWRRESGHDEAKLNVSLAGDWRGAPARVDLAATTLAQDTAGFIPGQGAYRDEVASRRNFNPEAYRDVHAVRLTGLLQPDLPGRLRLELRPYLRTSRMEFLQHFLLGKPLERNGQDSVGLMASLASEAMHGWTLTTGVDLELANSFLLEEQDGPTTDGTPAANAIRPAGRHYDYGVASRVVALYAHAERRLSERWRLVAGLRGERVAYDYDNHMLSGNTDQDGVPCGTTGCLYSRPGDRRDTFLDLAPKLGVLFEVTAGLVAYANASRGFRAPEMTELYRLQRQQDVADLDSERLDSLELGVKGSWPAVDVALALFAMDKANVILRESSGFNVGDGRTTHRGLEYELRVRPAGAMELTASGTHARHRYAFSRAVEGGETIVRGNDVDTAPRDLHRAAIDWQAADRLALEAEWLFVGEYWLDASNQHRYPGHELLNLRARWEVAPRWTLAARIDNVLDRAHADRADYAFGNYRYFPGRGRTLFAELAWTR
jgi:outer membrane receptor protein involved in Fe transport